jgi:hypothetical protein
METTAPLEPIVVKPIVGLRREADYWVMGFYYHWLDTHRDWLTSRGLTSNRLTAAQVAEFLQTFASSDLAGGRVEIGQFYGSEPADITLPIDLAASVFAHLGSEQPAH